MTTHVGLGHTFCLLLPSMHAFTSSSGVWAVVLAVARALAFLISPTLVPPTHSLTHSLTLSPLSLSLSLSLSLLKCLLSYGYLHDPERVGMPREKRRSGEANAAEWER